jgi:hypothetical protein
MWLAAFPAGKAFFLSALPGQVPLPPVSAKNRMNKDLGVVPPAGVLRPTAFRLSKFEPQPPALSPGREEPGACPRDLLNWFYCNRRVKRFVSSEVEFSLNGYNFDIMWKWLCFFVIVASAIVSVAYEQHSAREKYQVRAKADCVALAITVEEKHNCVKESQSHKDYAPWWYVLGTWPQGITTWAIIATLFAIAWQSNETRRAAKATEDAVLTADKSLVLQEKTSKQQLRAYMVLRRGKIVVLAGGQLRISLEMENSGQTPAYDFQGVNRSGFAAYPRNESWEPGQPNLVRSKGVIGSGRAFHVGGDTTHTQEGVEALRKDPTKVLFITALYNYLDIFKESHSLRIQLVVGGPMGVRLDVDESGEHSYFAYTDVEGNEGD